MNIFNKRLSDSGDDDRPIDPIRLYETCPYQEGYGYLRGIQEEVLSTWHEKRHQRDVICKMNTGSGKTLTGMLMLYSKLIENREPCLYACPDLQLVEQTIQLARQYGIPICTFEDQSHFPLDFVNSRKILVCTFQKMFNGRSIFNRDQIKIGAVLLDDAHKCVDIARDQSTLRLPRNHEISRKLFNLFKEELNFQLPGSFRRLEMGDPIMSMKVPYWAWLTNQSKTLGIISEFVQALDPSSKLEENDSISFKWNFIADNLLAYDCFIGGENIEITPIHVPYHEINSFNEASHRYILSATFEDSYDLIKDLGISYTAVLAPIVPKDRKDLGKRLMLAPSRFDPKIDDLSLRKFIAQFKKDNFNIVVLVPSKAKSEEWTKVGAEYVDKKNIEKAIEKLSTSDGNLMVFNNRYDGVDLHSRRCRILVIDGLPKYGSLLEQYTELRLDNQRIGKKAQIIEQGLGRAVRSGGDYCVVFLMGQELLSFLGTEKNLEHFTSVTKAQLTLGLKLLDGESTTDSFGIIKETSNFALSQHPDWITFHNQELSKIKEENVDEKKVRYLKLAEIESRALAEFKKRNYEPAGNMILDEIVNGLEVHPREMAWYYQFAAQLIFLGNVPLSNDLQSKACNLTTQMFHPPQGHIYKKILRKGPQASTVKNRLERFELPQDISIYTNSILKELRYTPEVDAKDFEKQLTELGKFLGFSAQMPEAELGDGPDVLWVMSDNHYLILEAKSQAIHDTISRENIGQLLQSEQWFKNQYGESANYTAVTLQRPNKKGNTVSIHEKVKVLDQNSLQLLHENLRLFSNSLLGTHPKAHSEENLARLLESCKFTPALFRTTYLKAIK